LIGLIPAGGRATRIAPLPCSKEVYPVGYQHSAESAVPRPKVACEYLLERMRLAGVYKAYIVLREGKWDIPAFLRDGKAQAMHLSYLMMDLTAGVPFTLDQAYAFVNKAIIVFGFPDILFWPKEAFQQLLKQQGQSNADVVLGLFPASDPSKADMVDIGPDSRLRSISIKPDRSDLRYAWINAVWTPAFTQFMNGYVAEKKSKASFAEIWKQNRPTKEYHFGDVIQAGIEQGLSVSYVQFPQGFYIDIGTAEDLYSAVKFEKIRT